MLREALPVFSSVAFLGDGDMRHGKRYTKRNRVVKKSVSLIVIRSQGGEGIDQRFLKESG